MTSWGELEDVKSMDIADVDTWEISSGSLELITSFVVDDKWSLSHDILGVSISTVTLSDLLGVSNLGEIVTGSDGVENSDERFGVWLGEVVDDEWELWDVVNVMSSCHDKRSDSGGSKGSATACLLWVMLTFLWIVLQILSGANILAFLHMLPKVA